MTCDNEHQPPFPITLLGELPEALLHFLQDRAIVTCEQAFDVASRCLRSNEFPTGIDRHQLEELCRRVEEVLPPRLITRLTEGRLRLWTKERPLGVLPPEISTESSEDNNASSPDKGES